MNCGYILPSISCRFADALINYAHDIQREERVRALAQTYRREFKPMQLVLIITDKAAEQVNGSAPFLAGLTRNGTITVYECANFVCQLPKVIN